MINPKEITAIALNEYADVANAFYVLINMNIQQYDGIIGIVTKNPTMASGLPTVDVQKHYLENPRPQDGFRKMLLERFEDLENSLDKTYKIIEKEPELKDQNVTDASKQILGLMSMAPIAKKIYFGYSNNNNQKREIIDIVDEVMVMEKEVTKMKNIFAGLNIDIQN